MRPTCRRRALVALGAFALAGPAPSPASVAPGTAPPAGPETDVAAIHFVDATERTGPDFRHFNGMSGRLYYVEVVGSGGALFDFDGDGDLDLYLVQGAMLGADLTPADGLFPWSGPEPPRDRLYRNDPVRLPDGTVEPRFVDVTEASGIRAEGYGIGAAVGDLDDDGHLDLYVLNFGRNEAWRNRGDGTFEAVAGDLGIADERFSTSASFADVDGDGRLDLYVVNYLAYSLAGNKTCLTERGEPDYCLPSAYLPQPDALYLRRDDGFVDASARLGEVEPANGLGVVAADADRDGAIDFYVANDLMANHLHLSRAGSDGPGFVEDALLQGVALNREGSAEASMGVDAGDIDGDGDLDLFLTHFNRESNTLYVRGDDGFFHDRSDASGLGTPSWPHTAFGTRFVDVDGDDDLDLVVANGAVTFPPGSDRDREPFPLDERNQVFRNDGGTFVDVTDEAGPAFLHSAVSRGVLVGDLDNDGDHDLVVTNNSGAAQVALNQLDRGDRWIGLDLRLSGPGGRPAYGAEVTYPAVDGGPPGVRRVHSDGSYASASDHRLLRGLAPGAEGATVDVLWPGGRRERFSVSGAGRYHRLVQGEGTDIVAPDG